MAHGSLLTVTAGLDQATRPLSLKPGNDERGPGGTWVIVSDRWYEPQPRLRDTNLPARAVVAPWPYT